MTTTQGQLSFSDEDLRRGQPPLEVIFGRTTEMREVRRKLEAVARTKVPVLIQGESGTGKELCARMIHGTSSRVGGWGARELVKVSCPSIPQSLLETELFGYEKGAFTGAHTLKRGRVEQAHGGTLFLDEVGSLDLGSQAKLLQVLQDGTFARVGRHEMQTIETRLVCVANRSLREQVEEGTFRLDLLFRINAVTIDLPPLRRRRADLPALVDYFMEIHADTFGVERRQVSKELLREMTLYDWPGNIRQLDNLIRSYVLMGSEEALLRELTAEVKAESAAAEIDVSQPLSLKAVTKRATQELEREIIAKVLRANYGNRQKTAKWLKMSYRSLLYKLEEAQGKEKPARKEETRGGDRTKEGRPGLSIGL